MLNFQSQDISQPLKVHSVLDSELRPVLKGILYIFIFSSKYGGTSSSVKGLCPNPVFLGRDSFARFISHKAPEKLVPENLTDSRNHRYHHFHQQLIFKSGQKFAKEISKTTANH